MIKPMGLAVLGVMYEVRWIITSIDIVIYSNIEW
jgi:hypothetical protein